MTHSHSDAPPLFPDGHPLDKIHYREYKILLRPERFFAPECFEEYWEIIGRIADRLDIRVEKNHKAFHRDVREVLFYDTPEFDLYNHSFILRKRTFYEDGWPKTDHELALKFRHADLNAATMVEMRPLIPAKAEIKFKDEVLPLKDKVGGWRSLYSHNCLLISPNIVLEQGVEDIEKVFPILQRVPMSRPRPILLVNNISVEEVQVEPGHFHFGHHYHAKATIAIWRNRATEKSIVGEFAFQASFDSADEIHQKARKKSEEFFCEIQTHAAEWVLLSTTKTAQVYGQARDGVKNHE